MCCQCLHAQTDSSKYQLDEFEVTTNKVVKIVQWHENISKKKLVPIIMSDLPILLDQATSIVTTSDVWSWIYRNSCAGTDATRVNITINGIPFNDAESCVFGEYADYLPLLARSRFKSVGSLQVHLLLVQPKI